MSVIADDRPEEKFATLLALVRLAKSRQHGTITRKQYIRLERRYVRSKPKRRAGLLICWYYEHSRQRRLELAAQGVRIRSQKPGRVHAYHLTQRGFGRLTEIEAKIEKSRKRRDLQLP